LKVLFDQGTPVPLRGHLSSHFVSTAYELGWATLKNGELLAAAEKSGFEVLVTTDTNLQYQQNLTQRKIALVVLKTTSWPRIQKNIKAIVTAIDLAKPNSFQSVEIN
jgi:predicted nuclease of predicted toxin-antitoxin system